MIIMPYTCWVPGCRGNYGGEPKVQLFSFPSNVDIHSKWLTAINRKDRTPSKYSKVCIMHFTKDDMITSTTATDSRTGYSITMNLRQPRLKSSAVPTQFLNCMPYFSKHVQQSVDCDICKKTFRNNFAFKVHYRIHKKAFECDICHDKFNTNGSLDKHMRKHSTTESSDCDICKEKFNNSTELNVHQKIHRENTIKCDICSLKFLNNSNLLIHQKSHTGDNLFECYICKKKYIRSYYLTKHLRLHSSETPFEFDDSNMRSRENGHLSKLNINNQSSGFDDLLTPKVENHFDRFEIECKIEIEPEEIRFDSGMNLQLKQEDITEYNLPQTVSEIISKLKQENNTEYDEL